MFASRSTLLLSLVAAASTALAFQQQAGPACTTAPGTACQYSYTGFDDSNGDLFTVVDGFCGPVRADGISYCADAGARCESDGAWSLPYCARMTSETLLLRLNRC